MMMMMIMMIMILVKCSDTLLLLTVCDPSLTLTQFCAHMKTVLFCRIYETLAQRFHDSLGCKTHCTNTYVLLTYLLAISSGQRNCDLHVNVPSQYEKVREKYQY